MPLTMALMNEVKSASISTARPARADGNGLGLVVRRGFSAPPSYHIDRLRQAPVGHFFNVSRMGSERCTATAIA